MQVGDLVKYGPHLAECWQKKGLGIVVQTGAFIKVVFPEWDGANWYHPDNLEVIK